MTQTLEQLLLLARLDSTSKIKNDETINLSSLIEEILSRNNQAILSKNLSVKSKSDTTKNIDVPKYYANLRITSYNVCYTKLLRF